MKIVLSKLGKVQHGSSDMTYKRRYFIAGYVVSGSSYIFTHTHNSNKRKKDKKLRRYKLLQNYPTKNPTFEELCAVHEVRIKVGRTAVCLLALAGSELID